MAAIAVGAQRSRSGRREAIFPMFVAELRQRLWHPFQWHSKNNVPQNDQQTVILLTSRGEIRERN